MKLLGLDFETSGIDPNNDRIIEIGAVLWDAERKTPLEVFGKLVSHPNLVLSEEIIQITGIQPRDLEEQGVPIEQALCPLEELFQRTDYVVAHNGNKFDRPFLERTLERAGMPLWDKPWIDTMTDVPYPDSIRARKLNHLAADHQVFNPLPHRAVFDVIVMLQILSKYPMEEVVRLARSPAVEIRADVSYDDRHLAKERGFRWDGERRIWCKVVKELHLSQESEATFPVQVLGRSA